MNKMPIININFRIKNIYSQIISIEYKQIKLNNKLIKKCRIKSKKKSELNLKQIESLEQDLIGENKDKLMQKRVYMNFKKINLIRPLLRLLNYEIVL